MRLRAILLFIASARLVAFAQEAPTAMPEVKSFNLSPDNLGEVTNTVNSFTGDVNFPINLMSVPGRNGMDINVSLAYSSSVQNQIDTWNLEAPAGIVGLGWTMDMPKIIADTKQTGTREDDTYYLIEGGSSNQFIRTNSGTDATGSYYTYELKNYQFWKIKFYYDNVEMTGSGSGSNKWEIIRDNGFRYVYGDKNSSRQTIQYVVRWENWIGNSSQILGQSQLATTWNLSEIINLRGEKLLFEYDNVEQFVGTASGQKHTEASYLKQITNPLGRKVQFFYKPKAAQFFIEPHTEQPEPDAYQENYEKKYLDHIDALDENGSVYSSAYLKYDVINSGLNTAKMLLAYVEQRNAAGQAKRGIQFDYSTTGGTKGFLQKVTYPTGGSVTYSYVGSANQLNFSDRKLTINAPAGYAEPQVWMGSDYVVVAWRELGSGGSHDTSVKTVKLYVYQWVGRWKEQFLQTLSTKAFDTNPNATYYFYQYEDFQVVTEDRFFGVLSRAAGDSYNLFVRYKDPSALGLWGYYTTSVDYGAGLPTLTSGENFIAVGSNQDDSTHPSHLYTFQGNSWKDDVLNQTSGDHFYTSGNNYFFSHNRVGTSGLAEMNFTYLNEEKKWTTKNWLNSLTFGPSNLQNNKSYWYGSNSFMTAMANDNPEFIYRWDLTYTNFFRDNNILGTWSDDSFVFNVDNAEIGIVQKGAPATGRVARFDGKYWVPSTNISAYFQYRVSHGQDYSIWTVDDRQRPVVGYLRKFNPNSLTWSDVDLTYTPNETLFGNSSGHNPLNAGYNFFTYSDKVYFRKPNGTWSADYTMSAPTGVNIEASSLKIGGDKYFIYRKSSGGNIVQHIRNGAAATTGTDVIGSYDALLGNMIPSLYFISPQAIVTYGASQMSDATFLTLYRIQNEKASQKQLDYPVNLITVYDGVKNYYTSFEYDFATATIDASGTTAQYYQVTTVPGSASASSRPFGYTKTYYRNGLDYTELNVPYFQNDLQWMGSPIRTESYDKNNSLVASQTTTNLTFSKNILNSDGTKVDIAYYVRPTMTVATSDNIQTIVNYSFDDNTGQLISETTNNIPSNDREVRNEYTYWWQKYDPTRSRNILTGVVQTSKRVNWVFKESQITRWKNWTAALNGSTEPGAYDSYVWKGSGPAPDTFTDWDVASTTPSASYWQYMGKLNAKDDNTGVPLENSGKAGEVSATIWDQNQVRVFATANAPLNKIAFTSFEDASKGNWSWTDGSILTASSKTGSKHFSLGTTGLSKSGLTASEKYTISFWAKSSGGSVTIDGVGTVNLGSLSNWTLFEYTVSGLSGVTLKKSGGADVLIDEVRLFPVSARMSTSTYHPIFGVSSTTDYNNQTSYTEYDEWGRVITQSDENKNIVKVNTYNIKN